LVLVALGAARLTAGFGAGLTTALGAGFTTGLGLGAGTTTGSGAFSSCTGDSKGCEPRTPGKPNDLKNLFFLREAIIYLLTLLE
jgi:hypothetical protein|tara:strand:- start:501 stop:752 length:252 start_codon:yes stop_codon:yes gene_type:complete